MRTHSSASDIPLEDSLAFLSQGQAVEGVVSVETQTANRGLTELE
jgi:hypothetical protein